MQATRLKAEPLATGTRRDLMRTAGAVAAAALLPVVVVRPAAATPADMQAVIARITGGARLNAGRVKIEIPPLVENGNTVPCAVTVTSPMTVADHVKAIHIVNEKNPQANVISCRFGPRAGRAALATRIRLSDTQSVAAIAELSDGTFWTDSVEVIITLGACLEDPI